MIMILQPITCNSKQQSVIALLFLIGEHSMEVRVLDEYSRGGIKNLSSFFITKEK
jgi:hypothetical protein